MPDDESPLLQSKRAAVERARASGATGGHDPSPSAERLPPGQVLTTKFPILDLGFKPPISTEEFRLTVTGEVENPVTLNWAALMALPRVTRALDFHCVTRWSRFDLEWTGLLFADLCDLVKPTPAARYILQRSRDGYSSNLPLEEALRPNVLIAYELDGQPIPLEHGGPARLIAPHLYAWKGAKFLSALLLSPVDQPGYWETRGYHNHGDPWAEERFE